MGYWVIKKEEYLKELMQENALWQAVLGQIELSVSRGNYMTWFKNTQLIKNKDGVVVVGVPNVFVKNQLERKFNDLISQTLSSNGIKAERIEYKIHTGIPPQVKLDDVVLKNPGQGAQEAAKPTRSADSMHPVYRLGLNERYTFENFIVGSSNELAYAACQAIVKKPGDKYNPLFIYGGVGVGKTHLIQAVGNAVMAAKPNARVVYTSSEQFLREFIDALRKKTTTDFAKFHRGADVWIVDDVQFLAGKEKVQEEFFHTFNNLYQVNKQIIMSSDKPAKDIPTLEERLRSRFSQGMTIDMQTPDFETRCAILHAKAMSQSIDLPQETAEFLAGRTQSNVRELEGSLNQVLAYCEVHSAQPTIQVVTAMYETRRSRPKHLSSRHIIERTARHFHISIEEILGPKRDKDIVVPRQVAMYMLRSELHLSFPKIAHELGRKDHTTAIHSIGKIEKELSYETPIKQHVIELREGLYA